MTKATRAIPPAARAAFDRLEMRVAAMRTTFRGQFASDDKLTAALADLKVTERASVDTRKAIRLLMRESANG